MINSRTLTRLYLQMDWTDRHYRFMMRLITKRTLLFTEMLVDQTVRSRSHQTHSGAQ